MAAVGGGVFISGSPKCYLKKEDGSYFDFEKALAPPIVQDGLVTIFPGETIYITFDAGEKGPENLRAVESADYPNTLTFRFSQEPKQPGCIGMMLRIDNSSKQHIKYDLGMQSIYSSEVFKTSSCSLMGGLSCYESWPHPIFQLVMTNFRWMDGSNVGCY